MSGDASQAIIDKITISVTEETGQLLVDKFAEVRSGVNRGCSEGRYDFCDCLQSSVINTTITVVRPIVAAIPFEDCNRNTASAP